MKKITKEDLIKVLINSNAEEIGLVTETIVKLNKRNNPLADSKVTKLSSGTFEFGSKSFNKRLEESLDSSMGEDGMNVGHVETKSLPWGSWVEGAENKVIEHTNKKGEHKFYLRYYNAIGFVDTSFSVNGNEPTEEDFENIDKFAQAKDKKTTTYVTENCGEVENTKLHTQVVDFDNIVLLTLDGEDYEIEK